MNSKEYCISLIASHSEEIRKNFGVETLRLFGSVSRLLQCSVDVVRMHNHINPFLLKEIEQDGIYVIKTLIRVLFEIER